MLLKLKFCSNSVTFAIVKVCRHNSSLDVVFKCQKPSKSIFPTFMKWFVRLLLIQESLNVIYTLFDFFVVLDQAIPLVGYLVGISDLETHHIHTSRQDQFPCRGSIYKFGKRRLIGIVPRFPFCMFLANEDKHLRRSPIGPSNLVG